MSKGKKRVKAAGGTVKKLARILKKVGKATRSY